MTKLGLLCRAAAAGIAVVLATTPMAAPAQIAAQMAAQTGPQVTNYQAKVDARLAAVKTVNRKGPFKPDWDQLRQHYRTPDWFRDAKFGIFIHWGVYSVPAFDNEWYPRNMYVPGNSAYEHHVKTYGPQDKFGYKDFVPMFKAEKFDAAQWVQLFKDAGAKYVIPVAEHCDGFAMYDTELSRWNVVAMGPKRDTAAELEKATRAAGLHFGLSSHRAEHWWWFDHGRSFPSDVQDPKFADLYGPASPTGLPADDPYTWPDSSQLQNWMPPSKAFLDDWMARTTEIVDKYKPDIIYFDWWTSAPMFRPLMKDIAAYYYNRSAEDGHQGIITFKDGQFADGSAVFDMERGKSDSLRIDPWQSDTSVGIKSWGYVTNETYRTPESLIINLVDIVSKNGNLLLNVGPKADGTIPEQTVAILRGMGKWLKVNGEAIYGSRPFHYYGEGPTSSGHVREVGKLNETNANPFTPQDFRFTTNGDALYAFGLKRPDDGKILIKTLFRDTPYLPAAIKSVTLLGGGAVQWEQTPKGLAVTLPPAGDDQYPYVLKIIAS